MDRLVVLEAVTTASRPPIRTVLAAGSEEKPEPMTVAGLPSINTSGETAVMVTGDAGPTVRAVNSTGVRPEADT